MENKYYEWVEIKDALPKLEDETLYTLITKEGNRNNDKGKYIKQLSHYVQSVLLPVSPSPLKQLREISDEDETRL